MTIRKSDRKVVCVRFTKGEKPLKTKLSKEEISTRNGKILEMSKEGAKQTEIAQKFGISAQRIGQILLSYKGKNLKRKAMPFVDSVSKSFSKENLVNAVLDSDINSNFKLKLVEALLSK